MVRKVDWSAEDDAPSATSSKCCANGCPMPGSISASTIGQASDWVCRAHHRAAISNWHEVTRRLNGGLPLVNFVKEMRLFFNGKQVDMRHLLITLKTNGYDDFLPLEDDRMNGRLNIRKWSARVEKQLIDMACGGLQEAEYTPAEKPRNGTQHNLAESIDAWMKKHHMEPA